ncbi:MAG TPA: phosphatase PAP2 family protein, partial [Niabella sp.]|nr:phosphatase PAP2 family protein [Niabella sp.]
AVATGTGVLRMLNNRHWLGDVVAGAGIGIASTKLAYFIHDRIKWKNQQKRALIIVPYFQNNSFGFNIQKLF